MKGLKVLASAVMMHFCTGRTETLMNTLDDNVHPMMIQTVVIICTRWDLAATAAAVVNYNLQGW